MKAIILAGGKGTRGRPYTEFFPKAMIPIDGRPVIEYITRYLRGFSFIKEIVIVTDLEGLGGQIRNYYGNQKGISFVQDSQSGTGGDLLHVARHLRGESEFVLWFADNLCAVDLAGMRETFAKRKSSACIATRTSRREETGWAIVEDDIITEFKEKPVMRLQMSECLGIYMLRADIIKRIRAKKGRGEINLSYDILQEMSGDGRISAHDIGSREWIDAESPTHLERNQKTVRKIKRQMGL